MDGEIDFLVGDDFSNLSLDLRQFLAETFFVFVGVDCRIHEIWSLPLFSNLLQHQILPQGEILVLFFGFHCR